MSLVFFVACIGCWFGFFFVGGGVFFGVVVVLFDCLFCLFVVVLFVCDFCVNWEV